MTIINIRGTSGSGKTTLARKLMDLYDDRVKVYDDLPAAQKQGVHVGYELFVSSRAPLFVAGRYETPTGGADTINKIDDLYALLRRHGDKRNSLYEGIMASEEVRRAVEMEKDVGGLVVVALTTPLKTCLEGVQARRDARGETKPLDPTNTEQRMKRVASACRRLRSAGVRVERLSRDEAFEFCRELLAGAAA